jgi:hypothetical protein
MQTYSGKPGFHFSIRLKESSGVSSNRADSIDQDVVVLLPSFNLF